MKKLSIILNFIFLLSFGAFSAYAEDKKSHFKNEASVGESVVVNSQNKEDEELLGVASGSAKSFIPQTTTIEPPSSEIEYLWPDEETNEKPTYRLMTPDSPSWDPSWSEHSAEPLTWSDVGRNINNHVEYYGGILTGGIHKFVWMPYHLGESIWNGALPRLGQTGLDVISGTPRGQEVLSNLYTQARNAPHTIQNALVENQRLRQTSPFLAGEQVGEWTETMLEVVALPPALKALSAEKNTLRGISFADDFANQLARVPEEHISHSRGIEPIRPKPVLPNNSTSSRRFVKTNRAEKVVAQSADDIELNLDAPLTRVQRTHNISSTKRAHDFLQKLEQEIRYDINRKTPMSFSSENGQVLRIKINNDVFVFTDSAVSPIDDFLVSHGISAMGDPLVFAGKEITIFTENGTVTGRVSSHLFATPMTTRTGETIWRGTLTTPEGEVHVFIAHGRVYVEPKIPLEELALQDLALTDNATNVPGMLDNHVQRVNELELIDDVGYGGTARISYPDTHNVWPRPTRTTGTSTETSCPLEITVRNESLDVTTQQVATVAQELSKNAATKTRPQPFVARVVYDHPEGLGSTTGFVTGNRSGIYNSIEDALNGTNRVAEAGNIIRGENLQESFQVGERVAYTKSDGTLAYQRVMERINGSQLKLEDGKIIQLIDVVGVVAQ